MNVVVNLDMNMLSESEVFSLLADRNFERLSIYAREFEEEILLDERLDLGVCRALFEALLNRDENSRAERWLDAILARSDDDVTLLSNKGRLCLLRNAWREAVPFYERALSFRPDIPSIQASLGLCYLNLSQHQRAVELYEAALALEPDQGHWWIYFAQAQVGVGALELGLKAYRRANELVPGESIQLEIKRLEERIFGQAQTPALAEGDSANHQAKGARPARRSLRAMGGIGKLDLSMYGNSIITSYRRYLEAFIDSGRKSILMRELSTIQGSEQVYAHRHDVDHSLELAYLMGAIEASCGVVATYYMLPPGDYGSNVNYYGSIEGGGVRHTRRLEYVCKALRDMGHEIGLHNNFVQLSLQTGTPVVDLIKREVAYFDSIGVAVVGSASHGSDFARKNRFTNYEIFSECRSGSSEFGRLVQSDDKTVEGTRYEFPLHSVVMGDVGLDYEAYFVPYSLYLSDTGSRFTMSAVAGATLSGEMPTISNRVLSTDAVKEGLRVTSGAAVSLVHADWWRVTNSGADSVAWLGRIGEV